MPLRLVYELEEDVVDRSSDEGTQVEKFSIDTVQGRLKKVTFPRVFAVEEFQQVENE